MEEARRRHPAQAGLRAPVPGLLRKAAAAGLAAGISIALYQTALALLLDLPAPGRLVAAMLLGPEALHRWYSLFTVTVVGLGIHTLLSLIFGILFGWMVQRAEWTPSAPRLIVAGSLYGAALWFLNFYLVAALFNWLWFPLLSASLLQGLLGHTLFFGAILGGTLACLSGMCKKTF